GEWVVAAAVRERLAGGVAHHELRLAGLDGADARERQRELAAERRHRGTARRWRGEQELVVVAAREHALAFEFDITDFLERRGTRDGFVLHHRPHLRALDDVAQIAGEAVAY